MPETKLDGKIARRDGTFDWLEGYPPQEFGIEAFLAEVDAIVMGRATYEITRSGGAVHVVYEAVR